MISCIFFVNAKAEIVLQQQYRDDVSRQAIDAFRLEVVQSKNVGVPIVQIDDCSFLYSRQADLYLVGVTKMNANPALVFQYLYRMVDVFKAYFHGQFDENAVKDNLELIYELLDETMDNGYPQVTAVNLLTNYIQSGKANFDVSKIAAGPSEMTSSITGSVDWRIPNKYKYKKNEVFLDVLEAVNLLMSAKGTVLRGDVSGKIMMKTFLTGMPECKFGLNDKVVIEKEAQKNARMGVPKRTPGIAIDDISFHRCVRLGQFDQDRTISFIPPDGEFELMKYRVTQNVNLPFKVIPVVNEMGRSRVEYDIKVRASFSPSLFATAVILKIPTPRNTASSKVNVSAGKCKYHPEHGLLVWKIKKFPGGQSFQLKGEVKLAATMGEEKVWSRPPIEMEFQVPMFTSSALHVRFLKVFERANYQTVKWVRYITRAGQYQIRM